MTKQLTMQSIFLVIISITILVDSNEARPLAVKEHMETLVKNTPIQPIVQGLSEKKSARQIMADVHNRISRAPVKEHLSSFSRNLHDMLSRLIPNRNLVEDIMGLPEPEMSQETSREIQRLHQRLYQSPRQTLPSPYTPQRAYPNRLPKPDEPVRTPYAFTKALPYTPQDVTRPSYTYTQQSPSQNLPFKRTYTPAAPQQINNIIKSKVITPKENLALSQQFYKIGEELGKKLKASQVQAEQYNPKLGWQERSSYKPTSTQKEEPKLLERTPDVGQQWIQALRSDHFNDIGTKPGNRFTTKLKKEPDFLDSLTSDWIVGNNPSTQNRYTSAHKLPVTSSRHSYGYPSYIQQPPKQLIPTPTNEQPMVMKFYDVMEDWAKDSNGVEQ